MNKEKIMIVDDDKNICELLRLCLEKEGYETCIAYDGTQAVSDFAKMNPSLMLLDVMMPKLDGWETLREIRKTSNLPIIMLTAKGDTFDKVLGLELGADDYMVKPVESKELLARIKAVLRRYESTPAKSDKEIVHSNLSVNISNYEFKLDGKQIDIPPKELELLYFLCSNPNRVFTREQLLEEVWGFDYFGDSRTVDVHVKRLREKLEGHENGWALKTVWGVGYKFEVK